MKRITALLLVLGLLFGLNPFVLADVTAESKRSYIIVLGTDSLKSSAGLKSFIDYKSVNFEVTVVSMPDIAKQFPATPDTVERLRQYLDTKVQPVAPYVLLVGTMEEIPMSRFYTYIDRLEYDAMTDACLLYDKPLSFFDGNGNGKPGEYVEYPTTKLIHKFVIGRLPTDSIAVLDTYFPALIGAEKRYESNPTLSGMVACAVASFVEEFQYNTDQQGEIVKATFPSVNWTTLYEKEGNYISSLPAVPLTSANFVSNWNKGLDIVFTSAHGGQWRRIFNDKDQDDIYDDGEDQWVCFWGSLVDLKNTVFFGYLNGCDTFIDDAWSKVSFPYIDDLLSGKMLNFLGYASLTLPTQDIPSLENVYSNIAQGFSFGDALMIAKAKTTKNDFLWPWWSITLAGDPSARLNNIASTTKSIFSVGTFQPKSPVNLSWNTTSPAWAYKIQVGTSADFTNLVKSDVVYTNADSITLLNAGDYFWRVCGMYDNGVGGWSDIGKITIADPLNLVVNSLPSEIETDSVTVSGSTNGDSVLVNNLQAAINNGKFSVVVSLDEGNNNIIVVANKGEQTITKNYIVIYKKPAQVEETVLILHIGSSTFTANGMPLTLDSPPVIKNGRTLVPIRAIIESLGGTVGWDGVSRKATVTLGDTSIELWIGKNIARVNGKNTPIDSANTKVVPEIISSRTMLPLRFISENLGCSVSWEDATKTITITYLSGK